MISIRWERKALLRRQAGLSLIELMIALAAGLIVIGAALTFTVSTVRAYGDNIRSTRLSQELRTSMNLVIRELRRGGYDSAAVTRVMTDDTPSEFLSFSAPASGDCLFYEYDRGEGVLGDAPAASEKRAIRFDRTTKALQMNTGSADSNCGGTPSDWVDLTDPRVVSITGFTPALTTNRFCSVIAKYDTSVPKDGIFEQYDLAEGAVRVVSLTLEGGMASDPEGVVRQVSDSVRIRSDELDYCTGVDATIGIQCNSAVTTNLCPSP